MEKHEIFTLNKPAQEKLEKHNLKHIFDEERELYSIVSINPNLDIKGMLKDETKAKAISEAAWYTLREYLTYKAEEDDIEVVLADKYFPSSQLCNCCGYKNNQVKDLNIRTWVCPECGVDHDRDLNAALNLKDYPDKYCTNL